MFRKKLLWLLPILLLGVMTESTNAQIWSDPINPAYYDTTVGGQAGDDVKLLVVNGKPAMIHVGDFNRLEYIRATDSNGTAWAKPKLIDSIRGGTPINIAIINGNPAIVYATDYNSYLMYVRANDADGSSWGTPIQVEPDDELGDKVVLKEVNGRPAIVYTANSDTLYYVRATDANGSSWGSVNNLGKIRFDDFDMEIANGHPAIAIRANDTTMSYARATDVDGSSWPAFSTIVSSGTNEGRNLDMEIVDGYPAIAYRRFSLGHLCYVRALDSNGSSWSSVVTVDSLNDADNFCSMAIIDGNPAIIFASYDNDSMQFVRATNSTGSSWGSTVSFDYVGEVGDLFEVNGQPAVACQDEDEYILHYVRAGNSTGSTWGSPLYWSGHSDDYTEDVALTVSTTPVMIISNAIDYRLEAWTGNTAGTAWSRAATIDTGDIRYDQLDATVNNGYPAVTYSTNSDHIMYCRATDSAGTSWGTPDTVIQVTHNIFNKTITVAGHPAIIYANGTSRNISYIRATDSAGSSWGSPIAISTTTGINDRNYFWPSFSIINNRPAVAWFREGTFNDLMYCIASDSTGSSWGTVQTVVSTFSSGWYPQLLTINGHPAIFYNYNAAFADSIRYIRATDSTGSSWGAAVTIDYSEFQPAFAAFVTDGKPVLFFDANDDQYFVAANDTIGSSWGTRDTLSYDFNLQPGSMKVATKDIRTYVIGKSSTTGNHHLYVYTEGNVWNGSTWSAGTPDSTSTAIIKSSTAPASFSVKDLYINDGFSLNTGTSATATIYGSLYNYGDGVSGQGTLTFTANGGAELIGDTVEHEGAVIVESGCTLTTNSKLRLTSDASNTGRIGESDGTINGDVYVQRYMPGKRCFRFYGHPFSSSIALSQLTDEIDITGSGGSTNGFTNTGSNNPSAFWFDVTAADTSTTGANPGWTAFTSATSADWDQYELLRLLVRGAKGEGLNGGAYTPSAATFEAVGAINQGTQVVTLAKGSNTEFVGCGNPFPSPVNMQNITRGSNVGANYYAWDATSGASGAYVTNAWTLSYNLPAYSAFFTTVSANSNNTLTFEEQDKVATGVGLFKTTGPNDWVELYIYDSTTKWDRLLINLNSNGMEVEDQLDGKKLYNPGLDFFTLSKDDVRLAVDVRPYDDGKSIPLGLTAYNRYNKYVIRTGMFSIPAGTKLVLHDKYLNKKEELKVGSEYWFDVTGDTASQGNNRFEINMVGKPTGVIETIRKPQMFLAPNPANKNVKVSFAQLDGEAQIQLISITGQTVFKQVVPEQTGSVTIPLHNVPNGIYIVELRSNNATFTEKLIKK